MTADELNPIKCEVCKELPLPGLICPKCGSTKVNQYRMMTGAIWCGNCGYRAEHKEIKNPFEREAEKDD